MAEQEVIKHTKKVYNIWTSTEHGLWHKLKEFFLEILIIVFAVTLSIWLHEWSEHSHQQKEVKEFLLGLRGDLQNDITEMEQDKATFLKSRDAFNYVLSVGYNQKLNSDSVQKHLNYFFNSTGLTANSGRYEGFKSAGKLGTIEDHVLQNDILDLYQEDFISLIISTDYYASAKRSVMDYYNENVKRTSDAGNNRNVVLASDRFRNMALELRNIKHILERYNKCIRKSKAIIKQIDQKYDRQ